MKFNHVLVLFLVAFAPLSYGFASAQIECKQVCVAKPFYSEGEAVIISGKVDAFLPNTPLLIQVFRDTNRVHIAQVEVAQDGTYSYSLIADGPYFKQDGKYLVQASYGVTGNVFEASFEFQTTATGQNPSQIFEVRAGDQGTFDVPYTINGGTVKNIIVDPAILGLIVTIQADNDGSITLDLGRQWIDAKTGPNGRTGDDDKYIIYIDGLEVPYQESSIRPESRLITIQFQEGDSDIEIIGTFVVPEFGPIAILILVVAVSSVLVLSKKNTFLRFS
ncbi:PEFG-CTERM sorting domain-containing protein [Candidatus Nitrosotenuis aquarius]|uniref:PEFG-CTERM sorting domain-containing protein n=1 Tax=Candidatus Nitrosotenuis aquarius TaxID=1846278 RepID=UPI000C1E93B9|nr:PEFG-CTERM sorting domain-containing protein [Candidatus Nitrosotenuis aquarius]